MKILPRSFYDRDSVVVAHDLIGKKIIRRINGHTITAIIIETEAYRSDDPACHAFRGMTKSNAPLFGPVGHVYVYRCHTHHCFNIIGRATELFTSGGVLIRGALIFTGFDYVKQLRPTQEKRVAKGPGVLTQCLSITMQDSNVDVTDKHSSLAVSQGIDIPDNEIDITTRIGISRAVENPWRFVVKKEALKGLENLDIP